MEDIFFPALQRNRQLRGCKDKLCNFFCDNCSIHCTDQILKEFAEKGVAAITYPPHPSNLFQGVDVLLFGRLKSTTKYLPKMMLIQQRSIILLDFSKPMK
jgi:hypothetical protein